MRNKLVMASIAISAMAGCGSNKALLGSSFKFPIKANESIVLVLF